MLSHVNELRTRFVLRSVRNRETPLPFHPLETRESSRERKALKFVVGKTMNTYQSVTRGLIYILCDCCFIQFYHIHVRSPYFHKSTKRIKDLLIPLAFCLTSKTKSLIYLKQNRMILYHFSFDAQFNSIYLIRRHFTFIMKKSDVCNETRNDKTYLLVLRYNSCTKWNRFPARALQHRQLQPSVSIAWQSVC